MRSLPRDTIRALAEAAGLDLDDELFEDLVASYRAYAPILVRIPREVPLSAEPAHVFDPRQTMPDNRATAHRADPSERRETGQ